MTQAEFDNFLQNSGTAFNARLAAAVAQDVQGGYYSSTHTGEEIDAFIDGEIVLPSATPGSQKKFLITVNDSGIITAVQKV